MTAELHDLAEHRRLREDTRRMAEAMAAALQTPEARAELALNRACMVLIRWQAMLATVKEPLCEALEWLLLYEVELGRQPDVAHALATLYLSEHLLPWNIEARLAARRAELTGQ